MRQSDCVIRRISKIQWNAIRIKGCENQPRNICDHSICICIITRDHNSLSAVFLCYFPHIVGMSLEEEKRIVKDYDVLLEKVYAQPIGGGVYKKNLPDNVAHMKEIGCEHFIVSTDGGQMQNPEWYNTIAEYIDYLYDSGFSQEEIDVMTKKNPGRMLGIE